MSLDIFWESTPVNDVCPNKVKGKQSSALFPLEYLPELINLMRAKNEDDFPLRVTAVVNGLTSERLPGKEPDRLVFVDKYTLTQYTSSKKAAVSGKPFPTKVTASSSSVVKKTEPAVVLKDLAVNAFAAATISKTPIKKDVASSSFPKNTSSAVHSIQKATQKKNIFDIAKTKNFGAGYNGKPIAVRGMLPMNGTSYPLNEQQKEILRDYLKIPKASEISDKCIFVLNSEYFVCDRGHHVMPPDAMRILNACTGLSLGAIAEQWYSLTHLEVGDVVTVSEDIQTFIRQMKPDVLKEGYAASGFRKAAMFGSHKGSHAVTVCIRYPTTEDRLQVLKDRNACTGCAKIGCIIGNKVHPTSFHRCCKPCADDNGQ